ncbi:EthD domain-containing protein [Mycena crocata]|nr:EthD domain-containing protein [Mycena crocata]
MSFRTDRVRLVILLKRKPTLSKEEFHKYWSGSHGALFSSLEIVQTNLLKYEQAHTNDAVLQQISQVMGAPMAEWDGMVIFEGESYAKIFAVFQDAEYQKIIVPDEEKFLDRQSAQMLPLDLFTVVDK